MVSLNLLPDVKKEYLKSQRQKRLVITASFLVTISAISVVVLMALYVFGVQKLQISNSQGNINKNILTLANTPDLAKTVSIQNQLSSLPELHNEKAAVKRLFNYLKVITPNDISLSGVTIDFVNSVADIRGEGDDFKAVNKFVDTLKNASYVYSENTENSVVAFNSVVLGSIGKSTDSIGFKVTFNYDPLLFDNTVDGLTLSVPAITSTRSQTEKPRSLFDGNGEEEETE